MGRSLGTGPAAFLASEYTCGGLILLSPYTSIKAAAKHYLGCFGKCASYAIPDIFKTLQVFPKIKCPVLIIHGAKDKVTSWKGSK